MLKLGIAKEDAGEKTMRGFVLGIALPLLALPLLAACASDPDYDKLADMGKVSCADWAGTHVQMSADATAAEKQWLTQDAQKAGLNVGEKPDLDYSGGTVSPGTIVMYVNARCWEHPNWTLSDAARDAHNAIRDWMALYAR